MTREENIFTLNFNLVLQAMQTTVVFSSRKALPPEGGRLSLNFAALPALHYSSTLGSQLDLPNRFETLVLTKHLQVYQDKTEEHRPTISFCK